MIYDTQWVSDVCSKVLSESPAETKLLQQLTIMDKNKTTDNWIISILKAVALVTSNQKKNHAV